MVRPNEFLKSEINVLSRGFVPPEEVATAERQPIAMVRSHVSWGAVIAGSLLTIGLLAHSATFAFACGVPAFDGTGPYGWGAGIWSVLTALIAFGSGAWLAGCLTSTVDARYRFLQGVVTWAVSIPLLVVLCEGAGLLLPGRAGVIVDNMREMILYGPRLGGAWGAVIAQFVGLIAAICGGALMDYQLRNRRTVTRTAAAERGPDAMYE